MIMTEEELRDLTTEVHNTFCPNGCNSEQCGWLWEEAAETTQGVPKWPRETHKSWENRTKFFLDEYGLDELKKDMKMYKEGTRLYGRKFRIIHLGVTSLSELKFLERGF
jgi:hypothetical protein